MSAPLLLLGDLRQGRSPPRTPSSSPVSPGRGYVWSSVGSCPWTRQGLPMALCRGYSVCPLQASSRAFGPKALPPALALSQPGL